jgi:SAM-dependent methyltransferase
MNSFWNDRYSQEAYAYGTAPNQFLKEQLDLLPAGKALFVAEGEGRNAVYAASIGWQSFAFDSSEAAKNKALLLAYNKKVSINYEVADANDVEYEQAAMDLIVLIYAHFPESIRHNVNTRLLQFLRPGGRILIEGFHTSQLGKASGGPKDLSMLYTKEKIAEDFVGMQTQLLEEKSVVLEEGPYHNGEASVLRYIGIKL